MNKNQPLNIAIIITAILLTGVLYGSPLLAQEKSLEWHPFEEAIQLGEETQKPILVDVWAPWCGWCKKMQKEVYPALSLTLSENFVLTRLNRDDNQTTQRYKSQTFTPLRLAQQLNVQSVPAFVILSPQGEYLLHFSGFIEAQDLMPLLEYFTSETNKKESTDEQTSRMTSHTKS